MKPIIVHSQARAELDDATAFYEQRKPGLGLELLSHVEQAIKEIRDNPRLGTPYKTTALRRYSVRRFPYAIFYAERAEDIWVVAIAHGRRRPDYWRRRHAE